MKRLLFLLVIALLYCNGINSQVKMTLKKKYKYRIYQLKDHLMAHIYTPSKIRLNIIF